MHNRAGSPLCDLSRLIIHFVHIFYKSMVWKTLKNLLLALKFTECEYKLLKLEFYSVLVDEFGVCGGGAGEGALSFIAYNWDIIPLIKIIGIFYKSMIRKTGSNKVIENKKKANDFNHLKRIIKRRRSMSKSGSTLGNAIALFPHLKWNCSEIVSWHFLQEHDMKNC